MKKIYKFLLLAVIASSSVFYSCETTNLDLLASQNALSTDKAAADLLLNSVQLNYWSSMTTFNDAGAQLGRIDYMFGRNYFNAWPSASFNGPWSNLYSGMIPDIANIQSLNDAGANLSFHLGISKIMEAHVLMMMVDYLGKAVWSESFNPGEFPSPNLDEGQAVYTAALGLLAEANTLLAGASAGTATDLFYGGNVSKWLKLSNSIKMRADLTVGNWAAVSTATGGIEAGADDFEFGFGTNVLSPDTRHPDYAQDYSDSGANIYQSNWLMNLMSGDSNEWLDLVNNYADEASLPSIPTSSDPRRRYYFYRQSFDTPGNFSLYYYLNSSGAVRVRDFPDYFSADNTNGETLQCSLQTVPTQLEFTPDEEIWCSTKLGYWGRTHGNDEGTPPDGFTRTAAGVYPAGGSFDNQSDISGVGVITTVAAIYAGMAKFKNGAVGLGNGAGGNGIEPIMLAANTHFMKAEAFLHLGDGTSAATHLEEGIRLSIAKVMSFGAKDASANAAMIPTTAEVEGFVSRIMGEFNAAAMTTALDGFGFPVAKDKMDILGEQYFVAMFGGASEAFNFIRRTGYPRTLARSIEANPGSFPRTFLYPANEVIANKNIVQKGDLKAKVFWDSGVTNPAN